MTAFLHYLALPLAKVLTLAQLTVCPPPGFAPKVDVFFLPRKPEYVTEAPIKSLTAEMQGHSEAAFETDGAFIGVHEGRTFISVSAEFSGQHDSSGSTCLDVSNVKVIIDYMPTIFIAKEVGKMECQRKMTQLHEERHVAIDLKTIKEYIPNMKLDALWYLRSLGPIGPFQEAETPVHTKEVIKGLEKAMDGTMKKLSVIRQRRQGLIDTIENYKQESALCPGELLRREDIEK